MAPTKGDATTTKKYPVSLEEFPFKTNFVKAHTLMIESQQRDPGTKYLIVEAESEGRSGYRVVPQKVVWKLRRSGVAIEVLY